MDISSISTETLRHELRRRRAEHATARGLKVESDEDSLFVPEKRSNLTSERTFQSQARTTYPRGRQLRPVTERKRRRSRSPSAEDLVSSSTKASQYVTISARAHGERVLSGRRSKSIAVAEQEEEDRQLAERLQAKEDDYSKRGFFGDSLSTVRTSQSNSNLSIGAHVGTKNNPIDLDRSTLFATPLSDRLNSFHPGKQRPKPTQYQQEAYDAAVAFELQKEEQKAQEERIQQASTRTRDCAVCGESALIVKLPSLSTCSHEAEVCGDCYAGWIASQLESNGWQEVKCPGTSCKTILTYEEIQAYASAAIFERYDAFQARSALSSDQNFRWCRAEGCSSGQIHDQDEVGNIFVCVECHARFCTAHEGAYHDNETCDEYDYRTSGQKERDERKKEEDASEEAVGKLTKRCPRESCGSPIEKNGGCNHMTCSKCRHQFCWDCLSSNWGRCGH